MTTFDRRRALKALAATATAGIAGSASAQTVNKGGGDTQKFVLIHGAWHGGFAWDGVSRALCAAGHDVDAPTLPGMNPGDVRAGIEFQDYVDAVVDVLRRQRRRVVLVGHSSAGQLLQAAAPRAADAINLLVFNNAFILANGQSQLDNIPADAAAGLTALSQTTPDNTVPVEPIDGFIRGALMEGDPVATQDALIARLLPQPFSLLSGTVDTRPFEQLRTPKAVLFNLRDHSADYLGMAARLGSYRVQTANGSHEMLFSAPDAYTKALLKLVDRSLAEDR
jgi:pimeloyl-ACP methyl ester carboxylesterase